MEEDVKKGKHIFSVLFIISLFLFSGFNIFFHGPVLLEEIKENREGWHNPKQAVRGIEEEMSEELLFRYPLIEGYGALQVLMGKKEEKEGYYGLPYNDYTEVAGDFAAWLRYYKVPLLDLETLCETNGLTQQEAFFRTDHHWTPRAAFEGYKNILQWMEQSFGVSLDPDGKLKDLAQYEQVTLPGYMLGSQGRETGLIYAGGTEDYTVIYPKTPGEYSLKRGMTGEYKTYQGSFKDALLDLEENGPGLENVYNGKAERVYLHNGVDEYVSIRNLEMDSGPKILLLRDSYATPVGAFLAQSFSQVDMLWTLQTDEEKLSKFLEENHYDYVLLALYPENLSGQAFPFGMENKP